MADTKKETEMNEKNVKAVLVELHGNDYTKKIDGVETLQKGEVKKLWYQNTNYPIEVLDLGDYWDICSESCLYPTTPDGVPILSDIGTLCDWIMVDASNLIREVNASEPGKWIEQPFDKYYPNGYYPNGCRVRATAYAELPPLSAEETIKASDLSIKAMTRIRVNGCTLYKEGTMDHGSNAWFPNLYDFVSETILGAIRAKGGPSASVVFHKGCLEVLSDGETSIDLELKAKSREGIVEFLRNIGVPNPETVKITKTTGDMNGVSCVYSLFTGTNRIKD